MDYSSDYRGPCQYSTPDNSNIALEKFIESMGQWCPFVADQERIRSDEMLALFMADNAKNILPYEQ